MEDLGDSLGIFLKTVLQLSSNNMIIRQVLPKSCDTQNYLDCWLNKETHWPWQSQFYPCTQWPAPAKHWDALMKSTNSAVTSRQQQVPALSFTAPVFFFPHFSPPLNTFPFKGQHMKSKLDGWFSRCLFWIDWEAF